MKKLVILACTLCLMSTAVFAVDDFKKPDCKNPPSREEMIKMRKAREAAFEQKLGLTDVQKAKAKEIRQKGHKEMKPIMDKIKDKRKEAEMVKMSRIAGWVQEERLNAIDKDIRNLEKKANVIRKKNMKEFESILTKDQKKILEEMKKEGRQKFEAGQSPCPCPEQHNPPEIAK